MCVCAVSYTHLDVYKRQLTLYIEIAPILTSHQVICGYWIVSFKTVRVFNKIFLFYGCYKLHIQRSTLLVCVCETKVLFNYWKQWQSIRRNKLDSVYPNNLLLKYSRTSLIHHLSCDELVKQTN